MWPTRNPHRSAGGVTEYTWDKTGDLVTINRPDGTIASRRLGPKGVEEYIDDQLISRILVTPATRTITIDDYTNPASPWRHLFGYDPRGLLVTHSIFPISDDEFTVDERAASSSEQWCYNAEGRRTRHLTLAGDSIDYAYTSTGELESIRHSQLGEVSLEWDGPGRLTKLGSPLGQQQWGYADGWVTHHTTSHGSTTISRDELGRVFEVTTPDGSVCYGYDGAGSLTSAVGTDGSSCRWDYDSAGRLVEMTMRDPMRTQICHLGYDVAGEPVSRVMRLDNRGNTVETHYRYDRCGRRVAAESSEGQCLSLIHISEPTRPY